MRNARRREQGSALLVAMMMMAMMGLIGVAALDTVTKDRQSAGFQSRNRLAFYAAEGGIAVGLNLVRGVDQRSDKPALAVTALGDAGAYPYGQPQYAGDPAVPDPISFLKDGGAAEGMSLQVPVQFVNTLWQVRVEGRTPEGGRTRLESVLSKVMDSGY
jgi:hypothetical protein